MRHDEHVRALGGALAAYGLDLGRYSAAHAQGYLARFPDPMAWSGSDARSSLISTFAIGETTFMRHPEHFATVRGIELGESAASNPAVGQALRRDLEGATAVARDPVGERAGQRLLERPEEHDRDEEQRAPEDGDLAVGLGADGAGCQDEERIRQQPGAQRGEREDAGAAEQPAVPLTLRGNGLGDRRVRAHWTTASMK